MARREKTKLDRRSPALSSASSAAYAPPPRSVRFSSVLVRYYDTVLGDNPSVSDGPPVALGWDFSPELDELVSVDAHEKRQDEATAPTQTLALFYRPIPPHRRLKHPCPVLPRAAREATLRSAGYSKSDVASAVRSVLREKRRRRRTYHNWRDGSKIETGFERLLLKGGSASARLFLRLSSFSSYYGSSSSAAASVAATTACAEGEEEEEDDAAEADEGTLQPPTLAGHGFALEAGGADIGLPSDESDDDVDGNDEDDDAAEGSFSPVPKSSGSSSSPPVLEVSVIQVRDDDGGEVCGFEAKAGAAHRRAPDKWRVAGAEPAPTVPVSRVALTKKNWKTKRASVVRFSDVRVRYYETVLGDHPSCSGGPPLSLGWDHLPELDEAFPLRPSDDGVSFDGDQTEGRDDDDDDDDEDRGSRAKPPTASIRGDFFGSESVTSCPVLPRPLREDILRSLGYSKSDVAAAVRSVLAAKRGRRQTYHNLYAMRVEEAAEGLLKRNKKGRRGAAGRLLRSRLYDVENYVEEFRGAAADLIRCDADGEEEEEGAADGVAPPSPGAPTTKGKDGEEGPATRDNDDGVGDATSSVAKAGAETSEKTAPADKGGARGKRRTDPQPLGPVRFGSVHVREYGVEPGDNPGATADGLWPSLALSWEYVQAGPPIDVDAHEERRRAAKRPPAAPERIPGKERERILRDEWCHAPSELRRAALSVRRAQARRRATMINMSNAMAEERREMAARRVKRALGMRKSGKEELDELWAKAEKHQFRSHVQLEEVFGDDASL